MISNGLNWLGRLSFMVGCVIPLIIFAGQCFQWLSTAKWVSVSFQNGLQTIGLPPLNCSWLGLQIFFEFVNGAPLTIILFLAGGAAIVVCRWLGDRVPAKWEPGRSQKAA